MKFKVGDKVFAKGIGTGTIQACINEHDLRDRNTQGYRYEVYFRHSGLWSLLEVSMRFLVNLTPNNINKLQG